MNKLPNKRLLTNQTKKKRLGNRLREKVIWGCDNTETTADIPITITTEVTENSYNVSDLIENLLG